MSRSVCRCVCRGAPREHGYACDYGILYFAASQTRVTIEFTDALMARTLELLGAARRTAAAGGHSAAAGGFAEMSALFAGGYLPAR